MDVRHNLALLRNSWINHSPESPMFSCLLLPNGMSLQEFTFQHEVTNKRAGGDRAAPLAASRARAAHAVKKRRRASSSVKAIPHAFFQKR